MLKYVFYSQSYLNDTFGVIKILYYMKTSNVARLKPIKSFTTSEKSQVFSGGCRSSLVAKVKETKKIKNRLKSIIFFPFVQFL